MESIVVACPKGLKESMVATPSVRESKVATLSCNGCLCSSSYGGNESSVASAIARSLPTPRWLNSCSIHKAYPSSTSDVAPEHPHHLPVGVTNTCRRIALKV